MNYNNNFPLCVTFDQMCIWIMDVRKQFTISDFRDCTSFTEGILYKRWGAHDCKIMEGKNSEKGFMSHWQRSHVQCTAYSKMCGTDRKNEGCRTKCNWNIIIIYKRMEIDEKLAK